MNICICGWYYTPNFYKTLNRIKDKYPVYIVCNKESEVVNGIPHTNRENTGLDWGAYNYYLENIWDRKNPVLFMQDDTIATSGFVFDQIAMLKNDKMLDVAFLFNNGPEAAYNGNAHGRAFYCSPRFLEAILEDGNFRYDKGNCGFIADGTYTSEKPPKGCMHHNYGIHSFVQQIARINRKKKYNPRKALHFDMLRLGRRGKL